MARLSIRCLLALAPLLAGACLLAHAQTPEPQAAPKAAAAPDLKDYRTVENAILAKVSAANPDGDGKTGYLGVSVQRDGQGRVVVEEVQAESPAAKAGLKKGDVITRVGDHSVASVQGFREWLQAHSADASVKLGLVRQQEALELTAKLAATSRPLVNKGGQQTGGGKGGGAVALPLWKKPDFRLGVICVEFSDVKHNSKISAEDWEEALFSVGSYANKKSPTGQSAHGSLNEYFLEQSGFAFHFDGKIFDWVDVGKKRGDYIQGSGTSNKTAVLTDALNKVADRNGKDAFKNLDGFLFIYAGDRYKTNAGAVYYPHAGGVMHNDKRMPYFVSPEGGSQMAAVNGFIKPACLMLGLPDLAARTENAGSRGLGVWCALSNPILDGRPQHLSAWAKEKLGWVKPAVIDPTVKQKLILAPIERSPSECFKVLVRPNGSEYYLLENRCKKGFDSDLPADGLLIWRVAKDRPVLCESHGIDSPSAPQTQLSAVPFPSSINNAFTPDTVPSSQSPSGGGLPVHITQIQRLADGRIAFWVGYEYR
jgi:M6 family metalloprotease-like protein